MTFKYDLTLLKTEDQLLHFLGVTPEQFEEVLSFDASSKSPLKPFLRHQIPKKNWQRGHRIVWEAVFLKDKYKALAWRLNNYLTHSLNNFPHPKTFGYIGGRNIKENALGHCGHKHLISVDIENFFPSIKASHIAKLLISTGMEPIISILLSRFVTIEESLPLGLSTSPVIANAVSLAMDEDLLKLSNSHGATYSRYADDITFSGNASLPSIEQISEIIKHHQFTVAKSKTRISTLGQAHYITGLSVSDPAQPHASRRKKHKLRQELYYASKFGIDDHFHHLGINNPQFIQHEINRIDGLVKFIAHHEPAHAHALKNKWNRILQTNGDSANFRPKNQARIPFFIHVDEAEYVRPDKVRMLALAMTATQHQDIINQLTKEELAASLGDIWAAGDPSILAKRGMHYSDATEDVRLAYVNRMQHMPFQGYVSMARLDSPDEYERTYLRLLNSMIRRRLIAAESQYAMLIFEQNDKVSQSAVHNAVMTVYDSLKASKNRHPEFCFVEFANKPNLGLSVPDFLLGVLGKYLFGDQAAPGKPPPRHQLLFERIRDKYRVILDLDNKMEYSRRNPIYPEQI